MKRNFIFVIILSIISVICFAGPVTLKKKKTIASGWEKKEVMTETRKWQANTNSKTVVRQSDDTVYSLGTIKKNLWLMPNVVVSKKEAAKYPLVIRFTNKTKAGYYSSLEILKRGLNPSNVGFSMTISGYLPDSIVNSCQLLQSFSSAHRRDVIPDYTGKHMLQERIYDCNNRLLGYVVYQYKNNYSIATEHYFGPDGLPVAIAQSKQYPDGLRMNIICDRKGNDSLLYLTDGHNVIPNKDGVYYIRNIHETSDNGGKIVIQRSLDEHFEPMIDRSGNGGFITTYDKYMQDSISVYIDEYGKPMIMPESAYDKTHVNVSSVRYHYNYKNWTLDSLEYLGLNGEPVQNIHGTHKIVVEYDTLGREIARKGLNLKGNLSPMDEYGMARYSVKWDSLSNVIEYRQYDRYGNSISAGGNNSSYYKAFQPVSNHEILNVGYVYNKNTRKEELSYKFSYSEKVDSFLYSDKSRKIIIYDTSHRPTSIRFFDKNGNPDKDTYCAIDSTRYVVSDDVNKSINTQFRVNGTVQSINEYDSLKNTNTVFRFNEDGRLTELYQSLFDKDDQLIRQTDCNRFGNPTRAGGSGGMRYLHADVTKALDGANTSISIKDEFGEPDYAISSDGKIYSYYGMNTSRFETWIPKDENANEIDGDEGTQKLRDALPKVMSIEIIDSAAYRLGLRDNDVILQYGNYKPALSHPLNERDFKKQWAVRSALDAMDYKEMVVFRIDDIKTGKVGLVRIPSLKGTPSQLGFIPHIRYLTQRQRNRITDCVNNSGFSLPDSTILPTEGHIAVYGYSEMFRSMRNNPYQHNVKDASILLGAFDYENNLSWTGLNNEDVDPVEKIVGLSVKNANSNFSKPRYYFTTDGHSVKSLQNCGQLFDCRLSDSDYKKVKALYSHISQEINTELLKRKLIDTRKLSGYWILASDSSESLRPAGYLYFDKKGNMLGELTYFALVPSEKTTEQVGSPFFRIIQPLDGKYRVGETMIMFEPDNKANAIYECIAVEDATMSQKELQKYFTDDFSKYSNWYKKRMTYYYDISDCSLVKSVDNNTLVLTDRDGKDFHFIKIKGKPEAHALPNIDKSQLSGTWISEIDMGTAILSFTANKQVHLRMLLYQDLDKSNLDENPYIEILAQTNGTWNYNKEVTVSLDWNNIEVFATTVGISSPDEKYAKLIQQIEVESPKLIKDRVPAENPFGNFISISDNELKFKELNLVRVPETKPCVTATVFDTDGYLAKQGLSGSFVVMKWCDWECTDSIDDFEREFEKQRENPKNIILMPISEDENGNDVYGNPLTLNVPAGKLGLRIASIPLNYCNYLMHIKSRWDRMKKNQISRKD